MTNKENLAKLVDALNLSDDIQPAITSPVEGAVFVGSGDSLSSALLAQAYGHRALSSGDITFTGALPFGTDTLVGISHSGTSGATVQAIRLARESGIRTIAVTSNAASPLAEAAAETQLVPALAVDEVVPVAGHVMLGLGVAAVSGEDTAGATDALAERLSALGALIEHTISALPEAAPDGVSVLSLPDLRGAADFWMLKLIEATGISVRTVSLEESGHVDYFIGPQPHLALQLVGGFGRPRFDRLAAALEHTGQTVQQVVFPENTRASTIDAFLYELAGAAVGALVAESAAARWNRPPFRGGAVNMDAAHIKLDGRPVV